MRTGFEVAALLVAGAIGAFAQSVDAAAMRTLLTGMKIPFLESAESWKLTLEGQEAMLVVGSTDLRLSLAREGSAPLERVNLWNAGHRFSRAYVDGGGLHLEADLDTGHGATRAAVEAFVTGFAGAAKSFAAEFAKLTERQPALRSRIGLPYGDFALWINPEEWTQSENRGGTILFRQAHGDGYAMIITEPGMVPDGIAGLKKVMLTNMRKNAPDIQVTVDDKRLVKGHEVLVLGIDGTVSGLPLRYLIHAYSGPSGTIQVLTYTARTGFEKSRPLFAELLDGLEIYETAGGPLPGSLSLNSGKAVVEYDQTKWKVQTARVGQYVLAHESGELFAQVIAEGIEVPPDKILEIALANLKREAPDAVAAAPAQVKVNGTVLLQVNTEATVRDMALSYQNYYYTGPAGTIQIMTWTPRNKLAGHQKDVAEFLNGFHVTADAATRR